MDNTTLRELQLTATEILDEIVRICEKHDITYYLVGGTLLGAVRHKGFIPWDDDIDIAMPREDYIKFKEICKKELDSRFFLQNNETEPEYWRPCPKIRKNDTFFGERALVNHNAHKGIFIDIFILDNASHEQCLLQDIQAVMFKIVRAMISQKANVYYEKMSFKRKIIKQIITPFLPLISKKRLHTMINDIMTMNKDSKSHYYINLCSKYGHRRTTMPKSAYYPPTKVEFEGKLYSAPRDWNYVLNKIYGDYMQLPKKNERTNHHS